MRFTRLFAVLLASSAAAVALVAAPIAGPKPRLPDTTLSLQGLTQYEVAIDRVSPTLSDAGFAPDRIKADWMRRLKESGLEAADGKGYAKLHLRMLDTTDPHVPGGVAYNLVLLVRQGVKIERTGETLQLPTYVDSTMGLEATANLAKAAQDNLDAMIERFIAEANRVNEK